MRGEASDGDGGRRADGGPGAASLAGIAPPPWAGASRLGLRGSGGGKDGKSPSR